MKLVEVGGHNQFIEMERGQRVKLMESPIVVDCKNIFKFKGTDNVVYLGVGKGD